MATKADRPAKPRRRAPPREPCPDTPDPVDLAMEFAASGQPMPEIARRVLEEHVELIHSQTELTSAQRAELRLRKVGEGVRAALWAMLALAAFALLTLVVAVLARASGADALVVQSFDVPASLQARGLTGKVVATKVLDRLAEMQQQTGSIRAASTYANNWEDELSIDIPNTGTTTDQIWKLLRRSLGKETRISGEVIETGQGLALTVRVASSAGQTFISEEGNLGALISQAAKMIYRETQPYRYASFLTADPRTWAESDTILRQLSRDPSPVERKWAFGGLAANARRYGNIHLTIAYAKRALSIDRNLIIGHSNLGQAYQILGREQEMVDTFNRADLVLGKEYDPVIARQLTCSMMGGAAASIPDPKAALEAANCLSTVTTPIGAVQEAINRFNYRSLRHEPWFDVTIPALADDSPAETRFRTAIYRLRAQIAGGQGASLSTALDDYNLELGERLKPGPEAAAIRALHPALIRPGLARALVLLDRTAEAEAMIKPSPLDCYECLLVRGLVAERLGRPREAQDWYAEAVRQGPRLARAYVDWARLLSRYRRFGGAERRFAKAAKIAPNWADPLKYWGDALAGQGKRDEALRKYDAALELAPRWTELKAARANLASRKN